MTMAAQDNLIIGLVATVASTLPDAIEMVGGTHNQDCHRGPSHDILFWGPVMLCLVILANWPGVFSAMPICPGILPAVSTGIVLGVMMHLMTDGLSKGGIPVLGRYRFAARWYKTFTRSEYKVSLLICLPCFAAAWFLGHLAIRAYGITTYLCG